MNYSLTKKPKANYAIDISTYGIVCLTELQQVPL